MPASRLKLVCTSSCRNGFETYKNLGVDGVDVVIGTSSFLREFSHGKDMAYITKTAIEVIEFVKSKGKFIAR